MLFLNEDTTKIKSNKENIDSSNEQSQQEVKDQKILIDKTQDIKIQTTNETKNINTTPTKEIIANKKPIISSKSPKREFVRKLSINRNYKKHRKPSEFEEKVIDIARVTSVVKGGRRFSFSVFVVVGNKKGKIGFGHGKANEIPDAIKKAIKNTRRQMIDVPIIDKRTIPHEQIGKFLASKILIKPAPQGKGIIASGAIRSVVELAGYKDIYTKSLGSRSKANSVKAIIRALKQLRTIESIAKLRDIEVSDIRS